MTDKATYEAIKEAIENRFLNDWITKRVKQEIEKSFQYGEMNAKGAVFQYMYLGDPTIPDPPDTRLESMAQFYENLASKGIITLPGHHSGIDGIHFYVNDAVMMMRNYDNYRIVGHCIYELLRYCYTGAFNLIWYLMGDDYKKQEAELKETIVIEAEKLDFHIDFILDDGNEMGLMFKGGKDYINLPRNEDGTIEDVCRCCRDHLLHG